MKILLVYSRYDIPYLATLAVQLRRHGHDVSLLRAPHIPVKNFKNPSFVITSTIKAIFTRQQYDIVHGYNIPSTFAMRCIRAKKKILSVNCMFSDAVAALHSGFLSRISSYVEKMVLGWPDVLVTDSRYTQKEYRDRLGVDFVHIPSALDTSRFSKVPDVTKKPDQVAYVGRDNYVKGIDILRSIESRINGKVVYCTDVSWEDAMKTMKESSIVVVPSRRESLPNVVKEAFFQKVPVIASNVGGVSEMIQNGKTGYLVDAGNAEQLLEVINHTLAHLDSTQPVVDAAYEFVTKNLTWDVVYDRQEKLYEDILA